MIVRSFEQRSVFTNHKVLNLNENNTLPTVWEVILMFGKKFHIPKIKSQVEQHLKFDLVKKTENLTPTTKAESSENPTTKAESSENPTTKAESENLVSNTETDSIKNLDSTTETESAVDLASEILPTSTGRTAVLIQEMLRLKRLTIEPVLDFSNDTVIYPILSKIGESPDNSLFLDDLVSDGILVKQLNEKIAICPSHSSSISSSMRIYCPKCNSMNVEKLHLFEHKKCGHILENKNSELASQENYVCTHCSLKIEDPDKQLKALAMWYQCEKCSERFDDANFKLHCIKENHDFDVNTAKLKGTFSYRLKTLHVSKNSDSTQIKNELVKVLEEHDFIVVKNENVKGKSGNIHEIPIVAKRKTNDELVLLFVKNQYDPVDISDMNSIVIPKLDINPNHTLFVAPSGMEEGVENIAIHYGIKIISDSDFSKTLSQLEDFLGTLKSKDSGPK